MTGVVASRAEPEIIRETDFRNVFVIAFRAQLIFLQIQACLSFNVTPCGSVKLTQAAWGLKALLPKIEAADQQKNYITKGA